MRLDSALGHGAMRIVLGLAVASLAAASVRGDVAALGRLLADDLTYTHASGVIDTKASVVSSIQSGKLKYKSIDPGQPRVRVYGNTAVLTGTATVQVESTMAGPAPFQIHYTDVYVKKGAGPWQAVAWQSTRPPAPPSPAP